MHPSQCPSTYLSAADNISGSMLDENEMRSQPVLLRASDFSIGARSSSVNVSFLGSCISPLDGRRKCPEYHTYCSYLITGGYRSTRGVSYGTHMYLYISAVGEYNFLGVQLSGALDELARVLAIREFINTAAASLTSLGFSSFAVPVVAPRPSTAFLSRCPLL